MTRKEPPDFSPAALAIIMLAVSATAPEKVRRIFVKLTGDKTDCMMANQYHKDFTCQMAYGLGWLSCDACEPKNLPAAGLAPLCEHHNFIVAIVW